MSVLEEYGIEFAPWMEEALCTQTDPEIFFPEKGGSTRQAKAVCKRCPVAAECVDYALWHDERHGIWGANSEPERRQLAQFPVAETADSGGRKPSRGDANLPTDRINEDQQKESA